MSTIQIVLEDELLAATDSLAAREGGNRSALIRKALVEHLWKVNIQDMEEQERLAYERFPDTLDDWEGWEKVVAWPED